MGLQETEKFQTNDLSPLLLYHNLNFVHSGSFIYASNSCIASCNPSARTVSSILNVKEEQINSVRSAITPKEFSRSDVVIMTIPSAAYVLCEKGISGKLTLKTDVHGLASCAAACALSGSAADVRTAVGTSSGCIYFSQCDVTKAAVPMKEISGSARHLSNVTALTMNDLNSKEEILALSGDSSGNLIVWNKKYQQVLHIPSGAPDCVSDVAILADHTRLAVSYGSGKIRVYSSIGQCEFEVCAHAKWINCMAYNPISQLLATAGEDGVLNVFHIERECLSYHSSTRITDGVPVGAAFNSTGRMILLSCYGNPVLQLFQLE